MGVQQPLAAVQAREPSVASLDSDGFAMKVVSSARRIGIDTLSWNCLEQQQVVRRFGADEPNFTSKPGSPAVRAPADEADGLHGLNPETPELRTPRSFDSALVWGPSKRVRPTVEADARGSRPTRHAHLVPCPH